MKIFSSNYSKKFIIPICFAQVMYLFGHIGITVGIVYLIATFISSRKKRVDPDTTFALDFRIVIIAAILPDIIDKIVGMIIFKEEISNGRIFTHSALVIGAISICLIIVDRMKFGPRLHTLYYILPLWMHLLLDRMWEENQTLFWPLFGTHFPKIDIEFSDYFSNLLSDPYIFTGEVLGLLIIIIISIKYRLFVKTHLIAFLKDGKLGMQPDL